MNDLILATQDPSARWTSPRFWVDHFTFAVGFAVAGVLVACLSWLTFPEDATWLGWGALLIHGFAAWGLIESSRILANIDIETAIAKFTRNRAKEEFDKVSAHAKDRLELAGIASLVLPVNPSTSVRVLEPLAGILMDAKERKFEAIATVGGTFREQTVGDILRLQTIQRTALHFGILGTFVGLVVAFGSLDMSQANQGTLNLSALMKLLHVSFSASVAGLEASVIVGLAIIYIRKRQDFLVHLVDEASLALQALARNAINKDDFMTEFSQVTTEVRKQTDAAVVLSHRIAEQTHSIQSGMSALRGTREEYSQFLETIKYNQNDFVAEMKRVYDVLSPESIGVQLQDSLGKATMRISEAVELELQDALANVQEVNSNLVRVTEALLSNGEHLRLLVDQVNNLVVTQEKTTTAICEQISRNQQDQSQLLTGAVESIRERLSSAERNDAAANRNSNNSIRAVEDAGELTSLRSIIGGNKRLRSKVANIFSILWKRSRISDELDKG